MLMRRNFKFAKQKWGLQLLCSVVFLTQFSSWQKALKNFESRMRMAIILKYVWTVQVLHVAVGFTFELENLTVSYWA